MTMTRKIAMIIAALSVAICLLLAMIHSPESKNFDTLKEISFVFFAIATYWCSAALSLKKDTYIIEKDHKLVIVNAYTNTGAIKTLIRKAGELMVGSREERENPSLPTTITKDNVRLVLSKGGVVESFSIEDAGKYYEE